MPSPSEPPAALIESDAATEVSAPRFTAPRPRPSRVMAAAKLLPAPARPPPRQTIEVQLDWLEVRDEDKNEVVASGPPPLPAGRPAVPGGPPPLPRRPATRSK